MVYYIQAVRKRSTISINVPDWLYPSDSNGCLGYEVDRTFNSGSVFTIFFISYKNGFFFTPKNMCTKNTVTYSPSRLGNNISN